MLPRDAQSPPTGLEDRGLRHDRRTLLQAVNLNLPVAALVGLVLGLALATRQAPAPTLESPAVHAPQPHPAALQACQPGVSDSTAPAFARLCLAQAPQTGDPNHVNL
jgi:hypothetical protein